MQTEKMLVEFRSSEYSTIENRIKALLPAFQAIGRELSECGIDHSQINLQSLVSEPKTVLMKFLPEEFQTVAKLVSYGSLHQSAMRFPPDFDDVIHAIEAAKLKAGNDLLTYASYYTISQEGEPRFVESQFEALRESCTVYTANEVENRRMALAQEICDVLAKYEEQAPELNIARFSIYSGIDQTLRNVVQMTGDRDTVKFKPVSSFVKKP